MEVTKWQPGDPVKRYTDEDKAEIQDYMLDLYAKRYTKMEIYSMTNAKYGVCNETMRTWFKAAINTQELPDPAYALKRDLLLVDAAIRALIPKMLEGNASAHTALERWVTRRAKWLGLDAPDKLEAIIRNVHTGPIEDEIQALSERLGLTAPPLELEQ